MDDNELLKGIMNKDQECFFKLVDLYKKKVFSLCFSYTDNYYDSEDLSQEVFLSLYNNIHKFRGEASISTYIYRITLSKCVDFKRKRSVKSFLSGLLYMENNKQDDIDEKNYIRQSIKALPEELKKTIILYYFIGLTQKEISEILKVSVKTVEGRIYRAKQKLRAEFEKEGYFLWRRNETI